MSEKYVSTLSKKSVDKAKRELNETDKKRGPAIEKLRKAVDEYPGLTCPQDDAFLLKFLRGRKFDHERALKLIVQHFRVRNQHPEMFEGVRPSSVNEKVLNYFNILPHKDAENRTMVWIRAGVWEKAICPAEDLIKYEVMASTLLLEDEEVQVNGVNFIGDLENFGLTKALQIPMSLSRTETEIFQDGMPMRIKAMHCIHEPGVIGYLWPLVKPFVSKKLQERTFFHGSSLDDFHKYVSPEILPPELGGTMTDYQDHIKKWHEKFQASDEYFENLEKYKLVEDTPGMKGEDVKSDALEGMSGIYRALTFD